jgi:hypothetical protein
MTDTMTSQNTVLSSWDTLYKLSVFKFKSGDNNCHGVGCDLRNVFV